MIEVDDSIAKLGVFRRLLPLVSESRQESFHAAAIQFSNGESRSSGAILKRATKGLGWKEKLRTLFLFAFWANMVDAPLLTIVGILSVPFALFSLIFG